MSESGSVKKASLETSTGLPHANELTTLSEKLSSGHNRDNTHEPTANCITSTQMSPRTPASNTTASNAANISFPHSEPLKYVKMETSEGQKIVGEPPRFDVNSEPAADQGLVTEEPLEIQCGENSALLYVSKLCQGSKGPCILFDGEWLTPNELQYISGRETAKDWKRSIRFKGKSLKSLIARGLIKVHPPICDCLGCRISSPVNRGRLASKCSVSPTSPARKRKEHSKSTSSWRHDEFDVGMAFRGPRNFSSSDADRCMMPSASNGVEFRDSRDSNSSTTSDCSDAGDDSPFTPAEAKRPRSVSPENTSKSMKRRSTDRFQYDQRSTFFFRDLPQEFVASSGAELSGQGAKKELSSVELSSPHRTPSQDASSGSNRSAFRTVHQDGSCGLNSLDDITESHANAEALQREVVARVAKNSKQQLLQQQQQQQQQQQPVVCQATPFFTPFTQLPSPSPLLSPAHTSPRLIPDPLLLASPHGSSIYHQALRGSLSGLSSLHQGLMHYRLLTPPTQHNALQQGIPLQSSLIQANAAAAAAAAAARAGLQTLPVTASSFKIQQHTSKPTSPKDTGLLNGHVDENQTKHRPTREDEEKLVPEARERRDDDGANENGNTHASDRESVIRRSPDVCTSSNDRQSPFATPKASPSGKDVPRIPPHKLVPSFRADLNENVLDWTVDDVCQLVTSLTGSTDIAHAFREEHIDGHSFVLMQEDHLLNRMSIRLGPALKIIAQIKKLTENMEENSST